MLGFLEYIDTLPLASILYSNITSTPRGVTILFQIVNSLDTNRYLWHSHGTI
jgi:hypothetical protein